MSVGETRPRTAAPAIPFQFDRGGFVLVVSGPSGVGKGTLVEHLMKQRKDCVFSISATTRPLRPGEQNGVQYEFLSREEFERRRSAGQFLEWAEVHGQFYGTPSRFVDEGVKAGRIVVLDVDVQGGASVRRARPDAVTVFVYPPSMDVLKQRLQARNTDAPEVVEQRLRNAPGELAQHREYDYLVINDKLDDAVAALVAIVDSERARVRRLHARPDTP
jgi:guanylate kinase